MLSALELENLHHLLRSSASDSIQLALNLAKSAKIRSWDALYKELIHICKSSEHPKIMDFSHLEKGRKTVERILFVNAASSLTVREKNRLGLLDNRLHFNEIKKIQCWDLGLRSLPECFMLYKELEELNLGNNCLRQLPDWLKKLPELKKLNLIANEFSVFPDIVLEMPLLEDLRLGVNQIKELPKGIGCLQNLKHLSLTDNKISSLPDSIFELKNLKTISLEKKLIPKEQIAQLKAAIPNCEIY